MPEYLYLESIRNNALAEVIVIAEEDQIFFLPYLLRRCDDIFDQSLATQDVFDVVFPYPRTCLSCLRLPSYLLKRVLRP